MSKKRMSLDEFKRAFRDASDVNDIELDTVSVVRRKDERKQTGRKLPPMPEMPRRKKKEHQEHRDNAITGTMHVVPDYVFEEITSTVKNVVGSTVPAKEETQVGVNEQQPNKEPKLYLIDINKLPNNVADLVALHGRIFHTKPRDDNQQRHTDRKHTTPQSSHKPRHREHETRDEHAPWRRNIRTTRCHVVHAYDRDKS